MNLLCVLPRSARHLQGENKYDCPLSSHDNAPVLCKISFMIKISDSVEEKVEDRLPTRAHTLEAASYVSPERDWSWKETQVPKSRKCSYPEVSLLFVSPWVLVLYKVKWLLFCNWS